MRKAARSTETGQGRAASWHDYYCTARPRLERLEQAALPYPSLKQPAAIPTCIGDPRVEGTHESMDVLGHLVHLGQARVRHIQSLRHIQSIGGRSLLHDGLGRSSEGERRSVRATRAATQGLKEGEETRQGCNRVIKDTCLLFSQRVKKTEGKQQEDFGHRSSGSFRERRDECGTVSKV